MKSNVTLKQAWSHPTAERTPVYNDKTSRVVDKLPAGAIDDNGELILILDGLGEFNYLT